MGDAEQARLSILAFADDVVLVAESPEELHQCVCQFEQDLKLIGLSLNESKCGVWMNKFHASQWKGRLPIVEQYKYLGAIFPSPTRDWTERAVLIASTPFRSRPQATVEHRLLFAHRNIVDWRTRRLRSFLWNLHFLNISTTELLNIESLCGEWVLRLLGMNDSAVEKASKLAAWLISGGLPLTVMRRLATMRMVERILSGPRPLPVLQWAVQHDSSVRALLAANGVPEPSVCCALSADARRALAYSWSMEVWQARLSGVPRSLLRDILTRIPPHLFECKILAVASRAPRACQAIYSVIEALVGGGTVKVDHVASTLVCLFRRDSTDEEVERAIAKVARTGATRVETS